jgi:hypothetical protein
MLMAKEKFELVFLAGGAMLDAVTYRLRRRPVSAREAVGAAMHTLCQTVDEQRSALADAGIDVEATLAHLALLRNALCANVPRQLLIAAYLTELAELVGPVQEAVDDVESLRSAVTAWLS